MKILLPTECWCGRKVKARGLCSSHYNIAWIAGTLPDNTPAYLDKARARLLSMTALGPDVGLSEPCLDFTGATGGTSDYGLFYLRPKQMTASRAAFKLFVGDPGDKQVGHRCDRPICVRPSHLFACTQQENEADKAAKGRKPKREELPQTKLSVAQVELAKDLSVPVGVMAKKLGVSHSLVSMIRSGKA